ncbi:CHAP domain-containing protein [Roseomonas sp. M0104]|uniref:CHAP domain-containing protein n=1 Tax=Teichococcus coralli TaxID=2545983 RepID=A0A845BEG9_9PROT|nr:peptidoglycan-binding protein [Pseudoroseomonas coralli]MXP65345.1 CHAP domain-containing protein [Pseudoroseomonas coralli]
MPDVTPQHLTTAFPGTTLRRNSPQTDAVRAVQAALNARGCGPVQADGIFGPATESAVRTFQSRFFDLRGAPLLIDGQVGPVTWAALFGASSLPPMAEGGALARAALTVAEKQLGVSEEPPGSNAGKAVEAFLASVGLGSGHAWCASFVYWCVEQAAEQTGQRNCLPRTGGVLEMWRRSRRAGLPCVTAAEARAQPVLVSSGMIFVMDFGQGHGHTGFVKGLADGRLATIEGNSSDGGSREGTGVFALSRRTLGNINAGFIGLP